MLCLPIYWQRAVLQPLSYKAGFAGMGCDDDTNLVLCFCVCKKFFINKENLQNMFPPSFQFTPHQPGEFLKGA